ncbi:MAG: 3-oxoacyl-ACP reductase [Cyclobacteriaceae bacterium]|nr:MAG: 3-oxoacyl-ACP reductase [Cyclobacteriaceae bacterium]
MNIDHRFKGQIAIVAGGARGIGGAIASRLAAEGARVAILDINQEALRRQVEEINRQGNQAFGFDLDLTDQEALVECLQTVFNWHQRIDVLVNCVGIIGPTGMSIVDYPLDQFELVMKVNVNSAFLLTKYTIPYMQSRMYGRILHVASIGGKDGNPNMVGYAASKSGLIGLIKGVGKEFAQSGITINGLAPAVIVTEMNKDTAPEVLNYMKDKIPMKRLGTVEEAAAISCWIVSQEASFNTGFVFDLSGGRAVY